MALKEARPEYVCRSTTPTDNAASYRDALSKCPKPSTLNPAPKNPGPRLLNSCLCKTSSSRISLTNVPAASESVAAGFDKQTAALFVVPMKLGHPYLYVVLGLLVVASTCKANPNERTVVRKGAPGRFWTLMGALRTGLKPLYRKVKNKDSLLHILYEMEKEHASRNWNDAYYVVKGAPASVKFEIRYPWYKTLCQKDGSISRSMIDGILAPFL